MATGEENVQHKFKAAATKMADFNTPKLYENLG